MPRDGGVPDDDGHEEAALPNDVCEQRVLQLLLVRCAWDSH